MANLYEINNSILECVDTETGEIIDEERLTNLMMAFDEKVENIGCWIKNLLSDAKAIKEEIDNLTARKRAYENKAESLKQYLFNALVGEKFKTSKLSISYRKSESVEVRDISAVSEEFLKYAEPAVDKAAVKAAIKAGREIDGCVLVEKQNLQIK